MDSLVVEVNESVKSSEDIATRITWKSYGGSSSCSAEHYYIVSINQDGKTTEEKASKNIFEQKEKLSGKVIVSVISVFKKDGKEYRSDSLVGDKFCSSREPSEPTVRCVSCKDFTSTDGKRYSVSYQTPITLHLSIEDCGVNCSAESQHTIDMTFAGGVYQSDESKIDCDFNITYTVNKDSLSTQKPDLVTSDFSLKINGNDFSNKLPPIVKCVVLPVSKSPKLISSSFVYYRDGTLIDVDNNESKSDGVIIKFTGVDNLYSPCFKGDARYVLRYWTATDDTLKSITMFSGSEELSQTSYTYKFEISDNEAYPSAVYKYQVVAIDVLGNEYKSEEGTIQKCANVPTINPPDLTSPGNNARDQPVRNLVFQWRQFSDEISALKCGPKERVMLVLELESEDEYSPSVGPQTSVYTASLSTKQIVLKNILLKLATHYFWRLTIVYDKGTDRGAERYSSNVFRFVTVPKDCAYVDCHEGECNSDTATCICHSGYHGEFCTESGISTSVIISVVAIVVFLLVIILVVSFYFLRKANFLGLRMPDFTKYMFMTPKCLDDTDRRESVHAIEDAIARDRYNNFAFAIAVLKGVGVTEIDNVCNAIVYAYEKAGQSLPLLLRLIEYEAEEAKLETVLFRSNSFASKCFKAYARMIGLPYLYHSLSPLLSKLVKDNQRADAGIRLEGNKAVLDGVQTSMNQNYELDSKNMNGTECDTSFVETNALSIQLACQTFISSLARTKRYCPNEFRIICKSINDNASAKFGQQCVQHAISAFMFLRYFVAALAVPESFGLLAEVPGQTLRRQCILIAKVLSNLSTGVKFGEKEDYMVIMNDYLESNENVLTPYYTFLITPDSESPKNVEIPPKIYDSSIEVLSCIVPRLETKGEM